MANNQDDSVDHRAHRKVKLSCRYAQNRKSTFGQIAMNHGPSFDGFHFMRSFS